MRRILTLISVFVVALSLFTIIAYSSSGVQSQSPNQAQSSTAAPAQHTNTEQKPVPEPATGTNAQDAKRAPATSAAEQAPMASRTSTMAWRMGGVKRDTMMASSRRSRASPVVKGS